MSDAKAKQALGLILWLLITAVAAALGSAGSMQAADFYRSLLRPDWAPSASVFGPVWTVLYILMAIAAWLVWRERAGRNATPALALYVAQLGANALWSWLFFAWHLGLAALADIVLLWILVVATLVAFWRIRRLAGVILIPYLVWVTFAALLNLRIWQLNPGLLS